MKSILSLSMRNKGFTLVEMAIVLVIVGLILTGLLMPLSAQYDLKNYSETRARVAVIKEAIFGFALVNGRLPCPAVATVASGNIGAGLEDCTLMPASGVVPWATLGLPETDAWNRRFTYRVTTSFSDSVALNTYTPPIACNPTPPPINVSFALCSIGDITITNGSVSIATNIPAVVVSHGKNGHGAFLSTGEQLPNSTATIEEQTNGNIISSNYISMTPNAQGFDDVVDWVSPNVIFNRMVSAGQLP